MKTYLSLDVGGSKYIVGIIDRDGRILCSKKGSWLSLTEDVVFNTLVEEAESLLRETDEKPVACGITIPGLADPKRGLWVEASFSGIRNFPICEKLSERLDIPCCCDNDAQAYSLAEMIFGACRDVKDFVYVNVSNGIGGSIVSGGRLLYGANGNAGEMGHCVIVENGRPCKCGSNGCLEMYAAGPGIARNYAESGGKGDADGSPADAKLIAERARAGETLAKEIFVREGEMLGGAIARAVNLLNPAKVIIGGGVSLAFDLFGPSLIETMQSQIYRGANPDCEVLPTPLGYMAGLYGAAAIAVSREERIFE